ncbi:hypothetical protein [Streptomyces hyaluromycini]|uniref:hypothetical protein n=1 Tax=Streptomyces hyaluromycini TaxID=1377993 RepID=UPI00123802E5|nr:hypothetical protein [Streptomyces hyaluromycini]
MSADERQPETPAVSRDTLDEGAERTVAGTAAVAAVLVPVVAGGTAGISLLVGYVLKMLDPSPAIAQDLLTMGWVFGAVAAAAILVAAVGLLLVALRGERPRGEDERAEPEQSPRPLGGAARQTLRAASFIVGERRAYLGEEWAAVLAGDPENGIVLSPRRRLRYVTGFLWAALRMRLRDVAAPLWLPVDWLLSAESRVQGVTAFTVGAQVVYVEYQDGFHALVTEGWGWCAGCGVALRLFVGWLRRIRGIELASTRSDSGGRSRGTG